MKNSDIHDIVFRTAVEAIDRGDIAELRSIIEKNPHLLTERLITENHGYFKEPFLLYFIADNPIRIDTLPGNIIEVTKFLTDELKKAHVQNLQEQLDYTLGLVATGRIPKECGVQIPLLELLISEGAHVKGNVLGPIGQHNFEAARYLLEKGADYTLATAVGLGHCHEIKELSVKATASELYVALVVASFFGNTECLSLLLEAGADVNGAADENAFAGFHAHAPALHQAVSSGSLEAVKLLVEKGADRGATDKTFGATALGWALHMQSEENTADKARREKYKEIGKYLSQ